MNKTQTLTSALLLVALILANVASSLGQATSGSIEGMVTNGAGQGVSGADISVESTDKTVGFKKNVAANEKGYFVLAEVPAGSYLVHIKTPNLAGYSKNITVVAGLSTRIFPVLEPGGTSGNGGITTTRYYGEELPARTTLSSALRFAPSLRPEILAGGLQITGSSGSENTYFIDGQEVTNFRTGLLNSNNDLPFVFLQEVQVISAGSEARFGGGTGGIINVVTLGGGNRWRGNFGVSSTPAELQGDSNVVLNRFSSVPGGFEYFQPRKDAGNAFFPTATLSGNIVKDKVWFLSSYSPQIYNLRRTIDYFTNGANPNNRAVRESVRYASNVRREESFLRLDSQPTSNLRLFGTFLYNPIIQDGALPSNTEGFNGVPQTANGLRGAEFLATRGGRQNANTVNGQVTWNATANFLLNVRAGRSFLNEKLGSYGTPRVTRFLCSSSGNPLGVPGSGCSPGFQNIANNSVRDYDASSRITFDTDTVLSGIEAVGRHTFRFGYHFNRLFNEVKDGYTDTGLVALFYGIPISNLTGQNSTPGNFGSGYLQRFGTVGEATSRNHAIFAQDSWQVLPRLTLNLGVRLENEAVANFVASGSNTLEFGWGDKFAPRLGFAFDLFGNGKTKAFGTYGWYYDRIKFELSRTLFGGDLFRRDYFEILPSRGALYSNYTYSAILGSNVDQPGGTCPITAGTGYSVCQLDFRVPINLPGSNAFSAGAVDPGIKAPRQTEYAIGVEQEWARGLSVAGRYIHKQLDRAIEDIGLINAQGSQAYVLGNPGFGLACEGTNSARVPCAKAKRDFDALEIRVDKYSSDYFFNANYTYSRLFGNYSGLASSDEFGRVAPNLTAYFNVPSEGFDSNGTPDNSRLATDRPHVFKAYGGYNFDWNGNSNRTSLSAFTTVQSGTPLTTIYNLFGASTSILFGRGDLGRTETFSETDLRVAHRYSFGRDRRFSVEPYFVVLNVFGERNEFARQTSISSTNFTSSTLTQSGCTSCSGQAAAYDTLFNRGGIRPFVQNFLNLRGVSSTGSRNDYNQPNLFQDPRYVRFGARFRF
ncbi:MAG: TonB-dependent receptor [Pyrinomonadaceae bacterium]